MLSWTQFCYQYVPNLLRAKKSPTIKIVGILYLIVMIQFIFFKISNPLPYSLESRFNFYICCLWQLKSQYSITVSFFLPVKFEQSWEHESVPHILVSCDNLRVKFCWCPNSKVACLQVHHVQHSLNLEVVIMALPKP